MTLIIGGWTEGEKTESESEKKISEKAEEGQEEMVSHREKSARSSQS